MSFLILSTPDGKTWQKVADDSIYMPAYKKAQALSLGSSLYFQVWRDRSAEGTKDEPMACFKSGKLWSFERDGFPVEG